MPADPAVKRAVAFVDGQNLFHAAKEAFGHKYPNYDVLKLAGEVCRLKGWSLRQVRFYTGVPDPTDNFFWYAFWTGKQAVMGRQGVVVFSRPLQYRTRSVRLPDGSDFTFLAAEEKGIDVRIALDVIRLGRTAAYDVAVIFSQDQDLSEVADEVRAISIGQDRWIKLACAFPTSPTYDNTRGINKTDWVRITRDTYDACLDPRDYRPKEANP